MRVLSPIPFKDSHLISTTASSNPEPNWNAGVSYSEGDLVWYNNKIWGSIASGTNTNTGHTPDISPEWWLFKNVANAYKMFDPQVNTQTIATNSLTVIVQPLEFFNSVAFVGVIGTSINVTITDGSSGPIVYNETKSLDGTVITDWYEYYFSPFDTLDIVNFTDIPPYVNARISVTLIGSGTVGIGTMLYGTTYYLGGTQYGAKSGITDYSVKQTDEFGNTKFVVRPFSKRTEVDLWMENTSIRFNHKLLSSLRAVPCLWIGVDDPTYEPLSVFGYYKDFNIAISYPSVSICSLEIEGLI